MLWEMYQCVKRGVDNVSKRRLTKKKWLEGGEWG